MHQRSHRRRSAVLAATGASALALALLSSPVAVATDPGASPEATPSATSSATPTATPSATPSESPTPEPTGQPEGSTPAPTLPPAEESAELSASSERLFDEALTVEEALAQVGKPELVAAIARANNVEESVATSIVDGADPTVRITPSGHISFFEPQSDGSANTADVDVEELRASLPPSANPQDGSYPESTKTIFLNFEGVELTNTYWNEESGEAISVGASGLNAAQQEQVWAAVAEDYAPFGVNVVIDSDPEGEALHKSSGDDQAYGVEVVVYAGEGGPADGAGGVALMNSFGQEGYNTAFVSVDGTGGGNPLDVGLASSHEAGHTFGLFHDSHEDSDSGYYSPGDPSNVWGPIMGAPYGSPLSQWSDASYGGGLTLDGDDNEQDDVADITDREGRSEPSGMICELPDGTILYSGFSYNEDTGECGEGPEPPEEERGEVRNIFHDRADYKGDDHGDDTSTATALDGDGDFSGQGVIGQADDVDYFRIDAGNGPLNVEVSPSDFAANLPVDVVVYDADGNEIGSDLAQDRTIERQDNSGGVSGLGASFESDGAVEAGEYYVEVRGGVHGDKADSTADLAGGWDRYGSLGHYSLTATAAEQPAAAVDITAPADGDSIPRSGATVEGTGEPGSTVTVAAGENEDATAEVDGDGNWSTELPDLAVGEVTITASQTADDEETTDSVTVTAQPDAPTVTAPEDGATVKTATPEVSGEAASGAEVTVYVDGEPVGTTTANDDGGFSLGLEDELSEDQHTASAHQVVNGVESEVSGEVTFTVDLSEPIQDVAITAPEDGDTIARDGAVAEGTGEPGASVEVAVGDNTLGTTEVNDDGAWSVELSGATAGERTLAATQNVDGQDEPSTDEVTVTVRPNAPTVTAPEDGATVNTATPEISGEAASEAEVTVYVDGEPAGSTTANQEGAFALQLEDELAEGEHTASAHQVVNDARSEVSGDVGFTVALPSEDVAITAPEDGDTVESEGAVVEGTGEPGASVEVAVGDGDPVTADVDDDGAWSTELGALDIGEHEITATQAVEGEDEPSTDTVTVAVAPSAPEITTPGDGDEAVTTTPTFAGTANVEAEVIVYIDGEEAGNVTADAEGAWEWIPEDDLSEGEHGISARQVVNDVRSPVSNVVHFTIEVPDDDDDDDDGSGDDGSGDDGSADDGSGDDGSGDDGSGDDGDEHPDTGANTAGFIALAAALLALGGAAVLIARRRGANVS